MDSFSPRKALRDRVLSIARVESVGHASSVLPAPGAVLGLQVSGCVIGPEGPLSPLGVTGVQESTRQYRYEGPTETYLVRFHPQGAACLGLPASHLRGRSQSLDELWTGSRRAAAADLLDQLRAATHMASRLALVEEFLLALPFRRDARLERALALLGGSGSLASGRASESARVASVARAVGLSERQLERLFLERVGVSPRRYAQLRRFERAQRLARSGRPLGQIAAEVGYADQPHFIREFKRFSGTTPGRLVSAVDFVD